eukprot:4603632-Alexandrium_andersonii.AAC.1
MQSPKFMTSTGPRVPALLRGSVVWGHSISDGGERKIDRPLVDLELLACQGWPVLLPANHEFAQKLPVVFHFAAVLHER